MAARAQKQARANGSLTTSHFNQVGTSLLNSSLSPPLASRLKLEEGRKEF